MSKVFLFRNLVSPNELQSKVFEDAKESMVLHIMKGAIGSILNYGENLENDHDHDWNESSRIGDTSSSNNNIMQHVIFDIFNHVYTMELTMEVNISIKHYEFDPSEQEDFINFNEELNLKDTLEGFSEQQEQFVSTPTDVFDFIERKLKGSKNKENEASASSLPSLFVLKVNQSYLEKSKKKSGSLLILNLNSSVVSRFLEQNYKLNESPLKQRPLCTLLKIIKTLAGTTKTQKRYYNIRLIRVLRDIVDSRESTCIINFVDKFVDAPETIDEHENTAEEWRELYEREKYKYNALKQKVSKCTCGCLSQTDGQILENPSSTSFSSSKSAQEPLFNEIQQLRAELLKKNNEIQYFRKKCFKTEANLLDQDDNLQQTLTEQNSMRKEMDEIKNDVDITLEELNEVHLVVEQLSKTFEHIATELEKKDKMLEKSNALHKKNNEEMIRQKGVFHDKLKEFSEIFNKLWQQQTELLSSQEQRRRTELKEIFEKINQEIEQIHNKKLDDAKRDASKLQGELKSLKRRHNDLINGVVQKETTKQMMKGK